MARLSLQLDQYAGVLVPSRHFPWAPKNGLALPGLTTLVMQLALADAQCNKSNHADWIRNQRNPLQQRLKSLDGPLQMGPYEIWVPQRCAKNVQTLQMYWQTQGISTHVLTGPRPSPSFPKSLIQCPQRILQQTNYSPHRDLVLSLRECHPNTQTDALLCATVAGLPPERGAVHGRTRGHQRVSLFPSPFPLDYSVRGAFCLPTSTLKEN